MGNEIDKQELDRYLTTNPYDDMLDQPFYCDFCGVGLEEKELIENCCPYCQTEIPEAVEG